MIISLRPITLLLLDKRQRTRVRVSIGLEVGFGKILIFLYLVNILSVERGVRKSLLVAFIVCTCWLNQIVLGQTSNSLPFIGPDSTCIQLLWDIIIVDIRDGLERADVI